MSDKNVFLVCGEDDYLVGAKAKELVDGIIPAAEQVTSLEVVEGNAGNASEVAECVSKCKAALSSGGLFSERKCLWLRDVSFVGGGRAGQSATAKEAVKGLVDFLKEGLVSESFLVVSSGKPDKRSAFYKFFGSKGEVFEFGAAKTYEQEKEAAAFASARMRDMGLKMDSDAVGYFVEKVGVSSRLLDSELNKLSLYVGERTSVTVADVEAVTSSTRTSIAWDLSDAFGEKDLVRTLKVLRRLLYQNESEVGIIISLQQRIRDLMIYREALDRGWMRQGGRWYEWTAVPPEAEEFFSSVMKSDPRKTHPFRANLLACQAAKFSLPELRAMLKISVKSHERLVSSSESKESILETLIVRLLRNRKKVARR